MQREKRGLSDMSARRKEREERAEKGLGVDLIPTLEEFEAFLAVAKSPQLASVIHVWRGNIC